MTTITQDDVARPWEDNGFTKALREYVEFRDKCLGDEPTAEDVRMLRLAVLELKARDEALA